MSRLNYFILIIFFGTLVGCGGSNPAKSNAPKNVQVRESESGNVITWEYDGQGASEFVIYRAEASVGNLTEIATVDAGGANRYEDPLPEGDTKTYRYAVSARGTGGESAIVDAGGSGQPPGAGELRVAVVLLEGDGAGTVNSTDSRITCSSSVSSSGTDCAQNYAIGSTVTLEASASLGATFVGWEGAGCNDSSLCSFDVTAANVNSGGNTIELKVMFDRTANALFVEKRGTGAGNVTSSPNGVACGSDCSATFPFAATQVSLITDVEDGSLFNGWGGDCARNSFPCLVTMEGENSVIAYYSQPSDSRYTVNEGQTLNVPAPGVLADYEALEGTLSVITTPTDDADHGQLILNADGSFSYDHDGSENDSDSFSYQVRDSQGNRATATVQLAISGANDPVIERFTINDTTVRSGATVTLTWEVSNATEVTISGLGTFPSNVTTTTDTPDEDTTYELTARNAAGTTSLERSVDVGAAPRISSFETTTVNNAGASATVTLEWAVTGTDPVSVSINPEPSGGGPSAKEGSTTDTTNGSRTYTLVATNPYGDAGEPGRDSEEIAVHLLETKKDGAGAGTVTGTGIDCGSDCSAVFDDGDRVTLTASPTGGSSFGGWSGACTNESGPCTVTMDKAEIVTATFVPPPINLAVETVGDGEGTVTSNPPGINCETDCVHTYAEGTVVTLTANPAGGSSFAGWGGACAGTTNPCTVTMNASKTVTATFDPPPARFDLTVTKTGGGTITSSPSGIDCGTDCFQPYAPGTEVTLTATADPDSTFTGWGGSCSGTNSCTLVMSEDKNVTAAFTASGPQTFNLLVEVAGGGTGTVTSSPSGINCTPDCGHTYEEGTVVTLTANPTARSTFAGWSGACTNATGTCVVTMSAARSVTATFDPPPTMFDLLVEREGSGTVVSAPSGIDCGTDCVDAYPPGTTVELTATPESGFTFDSWGDACSSATTNVCQLTMDGKKTVKVTFTADPVNTPPTARNDTASTSEDGSASGNLLTNDNDPDAGDTLSVTQVNGNAGDANVGRNFSLSSGARLTVGANGMFDYYPNGFFESLGPGESDTDSFTYTASDGEATDTATVTITITGVNDAPDARNDSVETDEDSNFIGNVFNDHGNGPDADPDSAFTVTQVSGDASKVDSAGVTSETAKGALITVNSSGGLTYNPNGKFESLDDGETDTDSFTYTISDGAATDTATVTVTIRGITDATVEATNRERDSHDSDGNEVMLRRQLGEA